MSQFLRPTGDVAQSGDWEAIPDDDILWNKIDEAIANDADYAWHNAIAATEYFEVHLSDPGDTPGIGTRTVRWRLDRIGGAKTTNMKCELREGAVIKGYQEVELTDALQALSFTHADSGITEWKSPGTCVTVDRDAKAFWADSAEGKTQNDDYAYSHVSVGTYSDWLRCIDFGFTTSDIPGGAIIVGIEVDIESHQATGAWISDSAIYLRKTSGQVGDNKASATPWQIGDTDTYVTYGNSGDTWTAGLGDTDIRNADFGIDISAKCTAELSAKYAYIDHVRIRVYWSAVISNWSDLRLRFLCSSVEGGGAASDPAIMWCEMEVPDAAAPSAFIPRIIGPF